MGARAPAGGWLTTGVHMVPRTAVGACGVYTVAAMLYMLRTAEVRALRTGAVASDRPRVFLNAVRGLG